MEGRTAVAGDGNVGGRPTAENPSHDVTGFTEASIRLSSGGRAPATVQIGVLAQ